MSGLMGMLSFAARSLDAQRFGLEVVGQNIANVNTEGYSKRVAEFAAVPPPDAWSAGGGVEIAGARSMRDRLIDRRLRFELADQERDSSVNDQMGVVEVALGEAGSSLDGALDSFFDSWATLADTPTSPTSRQEVILQGQALSAAFANMAGRLSQSQQDVDTRVRADVERVNALAEKIASLNMQVAGTSATSPEGLHVRDEINEAVQDLSKLIDVNVIETEGGGYTIDFAGGHPLVVGQFNYAVEIADAPVTGLARLTSGGVDVTARVTSGSIGGLLDVRDTKIPGYLTRLDTLATDVATQVNAVHATGFGLGGSTGVNFFQIGVPPGAATLSINAILTAAGGENFVAAAGVAGAAGDNATARRLADLRDAKVTGGGTASAAEAWSQLVYRVGRDKQAAADSLATQSEVTRPDSEPAGRRLRGVARRRGGGPHAVPARVRGQRPLLHDGERHVDDAAEHGRGVMRVTFGMTYRNGLHDIEGAAEALQLAQRQMSSGKRVQVPSDDPSAAAEIVGEYAEQRTVDSYARASDSVDARLRVVDSALADVLTNLETAQVKAAAAQVTYATQQQRDALALELEGVRDAVLGVANMSFRGTFVFSGTQSMTAPFPKSAGVVQAYQGDSSQQQIDVNNSQAVGVTFDGGAVFGDLFDRFTDLIAAVKSGNIDGAGVNMQDGMDALKAAYERVTTAQSKVGNNLSSIDEVAGRLATMRTASRIRRSTLEDANMAEAISNMKAADTAHSAAIGAVGAASRLSLMDYLR